jgi:hypothetical protein
MQTKVVAAAMGLIGALIGALIAFVGQLAVTRRAARGQWLQKLHERCAQVYALERECDLAAWEVLHQMDSDRFNTWNFSARRLAEAEILLLVDQPRLTKALEDLTEAGRLLSLEIIGFLKGDSDEQRVRSRRAEHNVTVTEFAEAARTALGTQRVLAPGVIARLRSRTFSRVVDSQPWPQIRQQGDI